MKLYVTTEAKLAELWALEQQRMASSWGGHIDTHDVDEILTEIDTAKLHDAFRGERGDPPKTFEVLQAHSQAILDICALAEAPCSQ